MSDVFDKATRSAVMSKVRSKNNQSTELKLLRLFRENGITGWMRFYPVKGHPDFVFLKKKIAVFVDGCFWHGHDCRNTHPKDNEKYWNEKRNRNISRDKKITALFENRSWIVVRIWECELKKKNIPKVLEKLKRIIWLQCLNATFTTLCFPCVLLLL
jgi:DNA mismatch endonuclease (patch repair protein)